MGAMENEDDIVRRYVALPLAKRRLLHRQLEQARIDIRALPIPPGLASGASAPLSPAQARMYFMWRLDPASAAYNIPGALRLRGQLDEASLHAAIRDIVARQASLRTTFGQTEAGELCQTVHPEGAFFYEAVDVDGEDQAARAAAALALATREAALPFDLVHGPLLRVTLLRLSPDERILLLTMHHIVADGWSVNLLVRELAGLYDQRAVGRQGPPTALPALPIQYSDYAVWQRSWLEAGVAERQVDYWKRMLGDGPQARLPVAGRASATPDAEGSEHTFRIEPELAQALRALAERENVTLPMLLRAVFMVLLYRHTGRGEIRVGVPVANRGRIETESLIGCFVNMQVSRAMPRGEQPFAAFLRELGQAAIDSQDHQDLPIELLMEGYERDHAAPESGLFQVVHNHFWRDRDVLARMRGLTVEAYARSSAAAQFDLMLNTVEQAGGLQASFTYRTSALPRTTVERLARHWTALLNGVVRAPTARIAELDMQSPEEIARHVQAWNRVAPVPLPEGGLHRQIEMRARLHPDATAVRFAGAALTYGELNARANRLAAQLRGMGVGPETLVGVMLDRSLDLVVTLLAVLKAGGAYVPLDPAAPAQRLAYMIADAAPAVIVLGGAASGVPPSAEGARLLDLDAARDAINRLPSEDARMTVHPAQLAYCIYTSGSTGRPKGVGNTHEAIVNRLCWMQAQYALEPGDRVLQKTPVTFDVSVWELFWPLMAGACLVVAEPEVHKDPAQLRALIEGEAVTVAHFVPSMLQAFVAADAIAGCRSLRHIVCSGEALPVDLQQRVMRAHPAALHNLYGPTEAAVDVTHWTCTDDAAIASVPIGRPIARTAIYLLDPDMNPMPSGSAAELYIGGIGLARGYLGRPGLTAERFLPDPFGPCGSRLYRTGDLARHRDDGVIEYLGRTDQQIKIRGVRVEPGEIEARLREQAEVSDAVVVAREDTPGRQQLVAYVARSDAATVAGLPGDLADMLRARLRATLPEAMVPAYIVVLDALPMTHNGKLDRKSLPPPNQARLAHIAPATPNERILATLWQDVLGVPDVGITDNFFDLGGDSIVSLQMVNLARQAGLEITPRELFQNQTVQALAAIARPIAPRAAQEAPAAHDDGIGRLSAAQRARLGGRMHQVRAVHPLTPMQQGMLFHTLLAPDAGMYVNQLSLRVSGLDIPRFAAAWEWAVRRHDVLRSAFLWETGADDAVQLVFADGDARIVEFNPTEGRAGGVADPRDVQALLEQERGHRFDLSRPAPLRLAAIRLAPAEVQLVFTHHHLLMDGWSVSRLLGEVLARYKGETPAAPAGRYADYIAWLDRQDRGAGERYWRERVALLDEPTRISDAFLRPRGETGAGVSRMVLDAGRTAALRRFAQRERVTLNTVVQGAWLVLLQRCTGQDTVACGTTVAGRPAALPGSQTLLGLFINTLPLVHRVPHAMAIGDWLRRLQADNLAMREHEYTPLHQIQRWAGRAGQALFDSIVVFENYPIDRALREAGAGDGLRFTDMRAASATHYALALEVHTGDTLDIEYNYQREQVGAAAIETIQRSMMQLLDEIGADAGRRVAVLGTVDASDRSRLAAIGRAPEAALPVPAEFVHARIWRQALARPDAIAVRDDAGALSYGDLAARAESLARRLADLGAGPDVPVAVCLERSAAIVPALLAVLMSGAAYVPLDPAYPEARLAYMVRDSRAAIVLTTRALRARLPREMPARLLLLDDLPPAAGAATPWRTDLHPGHLACVVYTSGSTGQPKGVALTHQALFAHFAAVGEHYGIAASDRILHFSSFSFDWGVEQWVLPLMHGACVRIRGNDVWEPATLVDTVRREGLTVLYLPTAYAATLADWAQARGASLPVRLFCVAGEALARETYERIRDSLQPGCIVNGYGPTETVITPLIWRALRETTIDTPYAPIGRPIGDRVVRVLDGMMHAAPIGAAGELYLGGPTLARGYMHQPGLTAARFVPDPDGPPGARRYRSGDRVRYLPDGELEYLGRNDHQVKIRGFRVEPGEIESLLLSHPGVRQAVVMAREDVLGQRRLTAYVVPVAVHEAGGPSADAWSEYLRARVPDYMVPSQWVLLEALPLSPNGKVDHKELPAPMREVSIHEEPATPVEAALAAVWRQVLGLASVGHSDNFFELGGDSIIALQVVGRAREAGISITPRQLFEHQTVRALARVAGVAVQAVPVGTPAASRSAANPSGAHLTAAQRGALDALPLPCEDAYPLSPMQRGMLFHSVFSPESVVYVNQLRMDIGNLDVHRFIAAWDWAVRRHPILRTGFFWQGDFDDPVQVVHADAPSPVRVEDGRGCASDPDIMDRLAARERELSFDLARPPLLRILLVRMDASTYHMVWTDHHVLMDGWSRSRLVAEVLQRYRGGEADVPAAGRYGDFIAWLRGRDGAADQAWWLARLAQLSVPTLLTGPPQDEEATTAGDAVIHVRVDKDTHALLRAGAQRERVTLNTLAQAAWALVLRRHTGQATVAFGATVSARPAELPGAEEILGLFINTLPVIQSPHGGQRVGDWLRELQASNVALREHAHTPLYEIQRWAGHDGRALFDSIVVFENYPIDAALRRQDDADPEFGPVTLAESNNYPVSLVIQTGDGLRADLAYRRSRVPDAQARKWLDEWWALAQALAADAASPIAAVAACAVASAAAAGEAGEAAGKRPATEAAGAAYRGLEHQDEVVQAWLRQWNPAPRQVEVTGGLHEQVERQAARRPRAPAVCCAGVTLDYGELNARANQLARRLRELGVSADTPVGVAMDRSVDLIVALLAVLKAGGAYVPLDPAYPAQRLAYLIGDARPRVVVTQPHMRDRLPAACAEDAAHTLAEGLEPQGQGRPEAPRRAGAGADILELPADEAGWRERFGAYPATDLDIPVHPDQLAYCIYTSGSTGQPKGAMLTHRNALRLFAASRSVYRLDETDVWTMFHSYAFDFSVWEIFGALAHGARLVVVPYETSRQPDAFLALLAHEGVTVLSQTPSAFRQLLQAWEAVGDTAALRYVVFGGEALDPASLAPWFKHHPAGGPELVNMYGITETTVHVTHRPLSPADARTSGSPIGRPLQDLHCYLLDADLNPVPPGVAGELYVGGPGLARGYHGRADLTAQRFVADPYAGLLTGQAGARMYRTGDLARCDETGAMHYLGRADQQVKIRGYRIEPGEIEAQLRAQPQVGDAVVVVREDVPGQPRLVGYFTGQARPESLRAALRASLPDYMQPAHLVALPALPLTANGKLDRAALPVPGETAHVHAPPSTDIERLLARIWQDVLDVSRVGLDDNFFELGGDSILTLQIVSRARRAGLAFGPRDLFQNPTVRALAAMAGQEAAAPQARPQGEVPLTPIQCWFFEQTIAARHHWNQSVLLRPLKNLDMPCLRAALQAVAARHDALRLRYVRDEEGTWRQRYDPADPDVQLWERAAHDAAAITAIADEAQRSLDLSEGPLLRAVFMHVADGSQRLLVVIHHLVVDGVSWRILLEDMRAAYLCLAAGRALPPSVRGTSFQSWAQRLQEHARSNAILGELPYWRAQEGHASETSPGATEPPRDQGRPARGVAVTRLGRQHTAALLRRAGAAYRTQINDLLLTALSRTLCARRGCASVLVELEAHGREDVFEDVDLSRTVGWFTTMFPVRLAPGATADWGASIKSIKEQLRAVPGKGLGYGLLKYLGDRPLQPAQAASSPDGGATARPDVTFNYLGQFDRSFGSAAADASHLGEAGHGDSPLPDRDAAPDTSALFVPAPEAGGSTQADPGRPNPSLVVNGQVYDGELRLDWHYDAGFHDPADMDALAASYRAELEAIVEHCAARGPRDFTPSDFPLARLTQAELDALALPVADIEDIYPLSPMQQGMLFHSLHQPGSGLYVNQLAVDVRNLDATRLTRAWQQVIARHDMLRTGFIWKDGMARPLQIVYRQVPDPDGLVEILDWRGRDAHEVGGLEAAAARRARDIDLGRPPLQHLLLARLDAERWRLVWTHHHVLMDGWAVSRLMGEVLRLYAGEPPTASGARYRDYIAWLDKRDPAADEAFWRRTLRDFEAPALPVQTEGASRDAPLRATRRSRSDSDATRALRAFAREQGITMNTLVQGAWTMVLKHRTGAGTVTFGATISGRPTELPGADRTLGLFINTLPVIQSPAGGQTVGDWLRGLQAYNAELREHAHTPLYEIQRWAGQGGRPLFDSIVVFENYPIDQALREGQGGELEFGEIDNVETTDLPLALVVKVADTLDIDYQYDTARFDAADVEGLDGRMRRVLQRLVQDAGMPLAGVDAPDAADAQAWLRQWNPAPRQVEVTGGLHEQVERQAARRPRAPAVCCAGVTLDYGELNARANQLARRLRELGVSADTPVGVAMDRSVDLIVALLAVLKAGGAYVPLDPAYPAQRLAYLIGDARPRVVVTQPHLRDQLPAARAEEAARTLAEGLEALAQPEAPRRTGAEILELPADEAGWRERFGAYPATDLDIPVHPGQLAYCIYTSGSTGQPKGAMLTHRNAQRLFAASRSVYRLDQNDVWTMFHSYAFDFSVWEIFGALTHGARLVVVPYETSRQPDAFLALLAHESVTVLSQTPSAFRQLLQAWEAVGDATAPTPEARREAAGSDTARRATAALRYVVFGGEALDPASLAPWFKHHPAGGPELVNMYGITETTVHVTHRPLSPADARTSGSPIGRPLQDLHCYLLDADLNPVPPGVAGELYVGGPGLARGYHGRADLTAQRFVADPYAGLLTGQAGARMYRTGDLARCDETGAMHYLGRADQQVKIRGYRIEPGEIEAQLRAQPQVGDAVVVVREDVPGQPRLVGYITGQARPESLRAALRASLPDYMQPAHLVALPALPLTANGKLDRAALPAPGETARVHAPPSTDIERLLARIWQDVLDVSRVGLDDNFFELGGHSLLAVQAMARIRQELSGDYPMGLIFQAPTLAELARTLQGSEATARADSDLQSMRELLADLSE
jgi:amino acid adenylation domain-containing protein/non-ribosomal peptide synthase protein (TIGR01720 family)